MAIVYRATCTVNGKSYVGFTSKASLCKRKAEHKADVKRGEFCRVFHNAVRKYGWDAFVWEVLFEGMYDDALYYEPIAIRQWGDYNLSTGGDVPSSTQESRRLRSLASKGKPKTPEHRAAIAEGRRGVKQSDTHRAANGRAKRKLCDLALLWVRCALSAKLSGHRIARVLGVSPMTISNIRRGVHYAGR